MLFALSSQIYAHNHRANQQSLAVNSVEKKVNQAMITYNEIKRYLKILKDDSDGRSAWYTTKCDKLKEQLLHIEDTISQKNQFLRLFHRKNHNRMHHIYIDIRANDPLFFIPAIEENLKKQRYLYIENLEKSIILIRNYSIDEQTSLPTEKSYKKIHKKISKRKRLKENCLSMHQQLFLGEHICLIIVKYLGNNITTMTDKLRLALQNQREIIAASEEISNIQQQSPSSLITALDTLISALNNNQYKNINLDHYSSLMTSEANEINALINEYLPYIPELSNRMQQLEKEQALVEEALDNNSFTYRPS